MLREKAAPAVVVISTSWGVAEELSPFPNNFRSSTWTCIFQFSSWWLKCYAMEGIPPYPTREERILERGHSESKNERRRSEIDGRHARKRKACRRVMGKRQRKRRQEDLRPAGPRFGGREGRRQGAGMVRKVRQKALYRSLSQLHLHARCTKCGLSFYLSPSLPPSRSNWVLGEMT